MKNNSRKYRAKKQLSPLDKAKEDFASKKPRVSREKRMENRAKKSIRILRSQGYSMAEALMITKGLRHSSANIIFFIVEMIH